MLYVVSDTKNKELPVCVEDNCEAIADFLHKSLASIYCCITRGNLIQKRYKIEKVDDTEGEDEDN